MDAQAKVRALYGVMQSLEVSCADHTSLQLVPFRSLGAGGPSVAAWPVGVQQAKSQKSRASSTVGDLHKQAQFA
jgi:hypothetical protein